jgi:outer membrane protein assembly factor BamD (BamD/ComL family)
MGKKQSGRREHLYVLFACIIIISILICGCAHFYERFATKPDFKEANDLMKRGNYKASLSKYEQIIVQFPEEGDRVLFEMGVIYAFPRNQQKDYQKSLECFQKIIKDYPESKYRQGSNLMIFLINEFTKQRKQIDKLERQVEEFEKKIEQMKEVDMNLKEKKKSVLER